MTDHRSSSEWRKGRAEFYTEDEMYRIGDAMADAWEAEREEQNIANDALAFLLNTPNGKLMQDNAALRERLVHILNWAGQRQDALTSRQVADAVMRMCQDALASQVVPNSDDIRTSHDTTAGTTADRRDKGPCWAGGNIAGE